MRKVDDVSKGYKWVIHPDFPPLLAAFMVLSMGIAVAAEQKGKNLKLTELEQTKLQLVTEREKNNAAQAALIRNAYTENQAKGQELEKEADSLHDDICKAHGITPAHCVISADGTEVQEVVPGAPSPSPGKK